MGNILHHLQRGLKQEEGQSGHLLPLPQQQPVLLDRMDVGSPAIDKTLPLLVEQEQQGGVTKSVMESGASSSYRWRQENEILQKGFHLEQQDEDGELESGGEDEDEEEGEEEDDLGIGASVGELDLLETRSASGSSLQGSRYADDDSLPGLDSDEGPEGRSPLESATPPPDLLRLLRQCTSGPAGSNQRGQRGLQQSPGQDGGLGDALPPPERRTIDSGTVAAALEAGPGGEEMASPSSQEEVSEPKNRGLLAWRANQRRLFKQRPPALVPSQLAQLAWCFDTLDYLPDPEWMGLFITRAEACLREAGPNEMADLLQVCVGGKGVDPRIPIPCGGKMSPNRSPKQGASPLPHTLSPEQGLAGIDYLPDDAFMADAVNRLRDLIPNMPAEPLRRCMKALTRLAFRPPTDCLEMAVTRACQVVDHLGPLGLPDALLATAHLSDGSSAAASASASARPSSSEGRLEEARARLVALALEASLPLLPSCPPDRLASLGWSLALLPPSSSAPGSQAQPKPSAEWLHEWLVCCRAQLKLLDARDLATVAWAAACMRHRPGPTWLEEYTREAGRRMAFFDAQVWGSHALRRKRALDLNTS